MLDLVALSEAMNNCAGVENAGKNHICCGKSPLRSGRERKKGTE